MQWAFFMATGRGALVAHRRAEFLITSCLRVLRLKSHRSHEHMVIMWSLTRGKLVKTGETLYFFAFSRIE
jgi:hypothetical protein